MTPREVRAAPHSHLSTPRILELSRSIQVIYDATSDVEQRLQGLFVRGASITDCKDLVVLAVDDDGFDSGFMLWLTAGDDFGRLIVPVMEGVESYDGVRCTSHLL